MKALQIPAAVTLDASATNITSETVWGNVTIPAEYLVPGRKIRVQAFVSFSATVGTDTWATKVRLGGVSGELLVSGGDHDIRDDEAASFDGWFIVGDDSKARGYAGLSGGAVDNGFVANEFATSATYGAADLTVDVTATCSTQAANIGTLQALRVEILPGVTA
ncbi:MAG: hypothetical protein ACYTFV_02570 [Planctomycetota bacterium]|jgi:hypothetical protein